MIPCAFCGEDSQGGTIGHLSSIPAETGILPFCGECEPIRKGSIGFMHPEDFEALMSYEERDRVAVAGSALRLGVPEDRVGATVRGRIFSGPKIQARLNEIEEMRLDIEYMEQELTVHFEALDAFLEEASVDSYVEDGVTYKLRLRLETITRLRVAEGWER